MEELSVTFSKDKSEELKSLKDITKEMEEVTERMKLISGMGGEIVSFSPIAEWLAGSFVLYGFTVQVRKSAELKDIDIA